MSQNRTILWLCLGINLRPTPRRQVSYEDYSEKQ